ncbi:RDD family protein [Novosphingobium gossypii]|uniref:RDD family protein n=1 Tax=Novosphingobium gossypii TaxID=1604774 RepID=UPI003D195CF5
MKRARRPRVPGRSAKERILVTPEGISLPVTVAGRGARVGALILDLLIILVLMGVTSYALFTIAGGAARIDRVMDGKGAAAQALQFLFIVWIVAMFLFRNAYFLYFELGPRGATPGKRMTGIRIAARDGGRLTAEMVIARNLLRDIEMFLPIPLIAMAGADSGMAWLAAAGWLAIFLLFPFFNRDALRAGDVIAGSWVLERPRQKLQAAMTAVEETGEAAAAADRFTFRFEDAELAVYGEFELKALERVLREDRADAIETVYQTIAEKIGRSDGWGAEQRFLSDYYTQLRARLEAGMRMGRRKADKHSGASA